MPSTLWYPRAELAAYNKEIDWLDDAIHIALLGAGYTPNRDAHDYFDDVVTQEITGTGYTAGGQALSSKTIAYTAANSWSVQWAASTAFGADAIVRPTTGNGFLYRAQGAGGTSGVSQPTWPTVIGDEVTDGGVTWTCVGRGIVTFDAADPSWANATISARYAVIYDRTPASDATRPLIALLDLDTTVSSTNATFSLPFTQPYILYKLIH
jgi:hypothetical protein